MLSILFQRILNSLVGPDAMGQMSMSVIMKCTSVIRQLAYDTTPDAFDGYLQMGEHTGHDCLDNFKLCIIELFSSEFLRKQSFKDIQNLYARHELVHGFPGMVGSIDCIHWKWINCPVSWQWQYGRGNKKIPNHNA